jgi:hypothetical protein
LADNEWIEVYTTGEQTDVGSSENTFVATIYSVWGADVTDNYDLTELCGTLTVTERGITLVTNNDRKIYDGYELRNDGWQLLGDLADGDWIDVRVSGVQIYVGVGEHAFAYTIYNAWGMDVTNNYNVSEVCGELTVLPRSLTIKTEDATKVYDGTPLKCELWSIQSGQLADGDFMEIHITGSQTDVGDGENTFTYTIYDMWGYNVTENYEVTEICGKLTVTVQMFGRPTTVELDMEQVKRAEE